MTFIENTKLLYLKNYKVNQTILFENIHSSISKLKEYKCILNVDRLSSEMNEYI